MHDAPLGWPEVYRALALPRPGLSAQLAMATQPRSQPGDFGHVGPPRAAAVLMLLYAEGGRLALPLTRRTETVRDHKGQISLPGGAVEIEDGSLWRTAIREAREELGLADEPQPLGALTPLYIAPSHFLVHPFVGRLDAPPAFQPEASEVAEVLALPLDVLLDPDAKREEWRLVRGRRTRVPFYAWEGRVIWGATAMMLAELEALLRAAREEQA